MFTYMAPSRRPSSHRYAYKEEKGSKTAKMPEDHADHQSSAVEVSALGHRILQVLFLTLPPPLSPPPPFVARGSALLWSSTAIAVLIANSNTWSTPFDSLALHSM